MGIERSCLRLLSVQKLAFRHIVELPIPSLTLIFGFSSFRVYHVIMRLIIMVIIITIIATLINNYRGSTRYQVLISGFKSSTDL